MKTAKERFDKEMAEIDAKKEDDEIARKTREVERELDHNVVSMKSQEASTLNSLGRLTRVQKRHHLDQTQRDTIKQVAERFRDDCLTDPVLAHLIKRRIELEESFNQQEKEAKSLYQEMLAKISAASEEATKMLGAIEHTDKEILAMVEANPDVLTGGSDLPPSA